MNEDQIERARRVCLALPETAEVQAWGEPTFRVRKKMFAMFANDHHRDGRVALWCPAPVGVQQMLVRSDAKKFFVPPYVGPKGWIGIFLPHVDDAELESLVVQAYGMIAPKKVLALLDAQGS